MSAREVFDHIRSNLAHLTIDEIKELLRPVLAGMAIDSPICDPGQFLYRARLLGSRFSKAAGITRGDLIYPPKSAATIGRLNRTSESIFYCSASKEAPFYELQALRPGDELVMGIWQTSAPMLLNNIGYTQRTFDSLGATRPCPTWRRDSPGDTGATISIPETISEQAKSLIASDPNHVLRELVSEEFSCIIAQGDDPSSIERYKLTVAISELHLGPIAGSTLQFAGVIYPSIRMWANSDNVALQPWFVDSHLKFRKAIHIRIDSKNASSFAAKCMDMAKTFDADGRLQWLGRLLNWQIQPGQTAKAIVTAGRDDDGDYESFTDTGEPYHWEFIDPITGHRIEPS